MKARGIAVCGLGPVGSFGQGCADWERMFGTDPGPNASVFVETPDGVREYPAHLADVKRLGEFLPLREFRRTDKLTRMVALGAALALHDAGFQDMDRSRIGLVLASGFGSSNTTFGFLESRIRYGDTGVSPLLFSNSGNSGPASNTAILLGITGPALTVCQLELPVVSALSAACRWLMEDRVDLVLFGGMDEYSSVLGYCRDRLFGTANNGPMDPFLPEAQTSVVGEGCCVLALSRGDDIKEGALALVEEVAMGPAGSVRREGDIYFLAADGNRWYGSEYLSTIRSEKPAASFTPYYGSFPSAMVFDLGVAATAFRHGVLPRPPERAMNASMRERTEHDHSIRPGESIVCFSCNALRHHGAVRMRAI